MTGVQTCALPICQYEISGIFTGKGDNRVCGAVFWLRDRALQKRIFERAEEMERTGISFTARTELLCGGGRGNQQYAEKVRGGADSVLLR